MANKNTMRKRVERDLYGKKTGKGKPTKTATGRLHKNYVK